MRTNRRPPRSWWTIKTMTNRHPRQRTSKEDPMSLTQKVESPMTFTRKSEYVVERAKALYRDSQNWADFSAEVFGQNDGLIAKHFTDEAERQLFYDTEQYKLLCEMRQKLMAKHGVNKGGTPEKSGRVLVRLPRSLHKALEVEASKEG